jgi:DNA-binding MarR family transcriptional regulator
MSRPYEPLDAPPEVVAIAKYNDLVTRNLRNSQVLEGLVELAGARLTRATFEVLANIDRRGPLRLSHLVARMGVDQSTISRQIRPLEELGLIERSEDPEDRRAVWMSTTPAGHEIIVQVRRKVNRNVEAALASWSQDDREQLGLLLDRFRSSVIELAVSSGFDTEAEDAGADDAEQVAAAGDDGADAKAAGSTDEDDRPGNGPGGGSSGTSGTSGTSGEAEGAVSAGRARQASGAVRNGGRARVRGREDVGNSAPGAAASADQGADADADSADSEAESSKAKLARAAGAGGRTGDGARPPRGGGPRRVRGMGGAS